MSYGYVYVAQIAMGADMNQTHQGSGMRLRHIMVRPSSSAMHPAKCTVSRAA